MKHFGMVIRFYRKYRRRMNQVDLGELVGVTDQTISDWEKLEDPTEIIRSENYVALARGLGMTAQQLDHAWKFEPADLTEHEQKTLDRMIQQNQAEDRRHKKGVEKRENLGLIPIINRAPAGNIVPYEECNSVTSRHGRAYLDRGRIVDPDAFAVVVTGDSMTPRLMDGEYAIFVPMDQEGRVVSNPSVRIKDGHPVYARFVDRQDGCTIALIYRLPDGRIELRKVNARKYAPIVCQPEEVKLFALAESRRQEIDGLTLEKDEPFNDGGHLDS